MRAQGGDNLFTLLLPSNGHLRRFYPGLVYVDGEHVYKPVLAEGCGPPT